MKDFRFSLQASFSPKIGDLVNMLEYTRQTTLNAVEQLTIEQLDFRHEPDGNSIGTLLSHIAAVEWAYSLPTFESRKPTSAEKERWGPALRLGPGALQVYRGFDLSVYAALLEEVRKNTLTQLSKHDDLWLGEEWILSDGSLVDNHWALFHVFEDELSHRGQILLICNHLLPRKFSV